MSKVNVRTSKRANAARRIREAVKHLERAKAARKSAEKSLAQMEIAIAKLEAALTQGSHSSISAEHREPGGKARVLNGLPSPLTRKIGNRIENLKALVEEVRAYAVTEEEKALARRNGRGH